MALILSAFKSQTHQSLFKTHQSSFKTHQSSFKTHQSSFKTHQSSFKTYLFLHLQDYVFQICPWGSKVQHKHTGLYPKLLLAVKKQIITEMGRQSFTSKRTAASSELLLGIPRNNFALMVFAFLASCFVDNGNLRNVRLGMAYVTAVSVSSWENHASRKHSEFFIKTIFSNF